jgi:hypothetical protein
VGTLLALRGIFFTAAVFAAGMAPSALLIRKDSVSYEGARAGGDQGSTTDDGGKGRTSFLELLKDRRVITFTISVVLFYCANAATLPLVGEILSKENRGRQSVWQVAAAVILAEVVMIAVAAISGKLADRWGRKPCFF